MLTLVLKFVSYNSYSSKVNWLTSCNSSEAKYLFYDEIKFLDSCNSLFTDLEKVLEEFDKYGELEISFKADF